MSGKAKFQNFFIGSLVGFCLALSFIPLIGEFDISVSIYQQGNDKSTHSDENKKGVDTFDFILANLTKNHTQFGKVFSKLILALESNSDEYLKLNDIFQEFSSLATNKNVSSK